MLPLILLAGCHKTARNDQRSASGQVLQGTISDDMLPVDKLKSQGPVLAPTEAKTTPEGVADQQSGVTDITSESSVAPDVGAAPTPAPSASAAP
ncbi:MAG: hypothetical protein J2O44_05470 [Porphyrobacter sp.]|nr:hypothetical protein [Porphyrobacter sp.]